MEGSEGRETMKHTRWKRGKTVVNKIWRKTGMEEKKRGNERVEREDRPLNTSDGREVRELEPRLIEERKMKGDIEE